MTIKIRFVTFVALLLVGTVALAQAPVHDQEEPPSPPPAGAVGPEPQMQPGGPQHTAPGQPGHVPHMQHAPRGPQEPEPAHAPMPPHAQMPPEQAPHYQLDFVVKEVENGKAINSRSYSIVVAANNDARPEQVRVDDLVKVPTGEGNEVSTFGLSLYIDINNVVERNGQLYLRIGAHVESLGAGSASKHPVLRKNRWDANAVVQIGKQTVLFSSDDLASSHTMQLELKAAPIK